MPPRKSIALRKTMKNIKTGDARASAPENDSGLPTRTTVLPTKVRHAEAACAVLLWAGYIPVLCYAGSNVLNTFIVGVVIALILHAYTMRPYCVEFDEEEEEAMMMAQEHSTVRWSHNATDKYTDQLARVWDFHGNKDNQEECRLVTFVLVLICALGSHIAFMTGGSDVIRTWTAPTANHCSVADLVKLEQQYARFHCHDGYVDEAQQRSMMVRSGHLVKTYTAYRIAPIYVDRDRKNDHPVAWTVSKNLKLTHKPCGEHGLCGLFASAMFFRADEADFDTLKKVASDEVAESGSEKKFDRDSVPAVILTSLSDPEGKASHFYLGLTFYLLVLLGLCREQLSMFSETPSKLDGHVIFGVSPGYDQLTERETNEVPLRMMSGQNTDNME